VKQNKILLPINATIQQTQEFAFNTVYQYRKSHRYASVLQSILVQVLLREQLGFQTEFLHVYSHLLNHMYLPNKKNQMNSKEREKKMDKMRTKYQDKTMFFLEGNFRVD